MSKTTGTIRLFEGVQRVICDAGGPFLCPALSQRLKAIPVHWIPDAVIADQRLLWLFPLIYLVIRGPGLISMDAVLERMFRREYI